MDERDRVERTTVVNSGNGAGAAALIAIVLLALGVFFFVSWDVDGGTTASVSEPATIETPDVTVTVPEAPDVDVNVQAPAAQ